MITHGHTLSSRATSSHKLLNHNLQVGAKFARIGQANGDVLGMFLSLGYRLEVCDFQLTIQCCAVLRGSNKEVVVKVLKPGVEDVLQTDLNMLHVISKVFEFINPDLSRISLVDVVGDVRYAALSDRGGPQAIVLHVKLLHIDLEQRPLQT